MEIYINHNNFNVVSIAQNGLVIITGHLIIDFKQQLSPLDGMQFDLDWFSNTRGESFMVTNQHNHMITPLDNYHLSINCTVWSILHHDTKNKNTGEKCKQP